MPNLARRPRAELHLRACRRRKCGNVPAVRPWVFVYAVTALVLLCAAHPRAAAASLPLELRWDAPDDCPRAAAFEAAVSRLVGSASSATVRAKVRITRDDTGNYTLALTTELNEISGERVLQGRVCQVLVDAAAVTVALILNPNIEIASEVDTPTEPKAATPAQPADVKVVAPASQPAAQSKSTPIRWLGTGALGLTFGVFPRPIPDVSLGLGLASPKYSARFSASYSPPKDVYLAEPSNVGGRLWLLSLKLAGCWTAAASAPRIGACFEGNWTRMQGDGLNVPVKRRAVTTYWFAPGLGVFADQQLAPHAMFELAASVAVPIYRPDMHLDFPGTTQIVQRPEVLTGNLQAGVIVSFN